MKRYHQFTMLISLLNVLYCKGLEFTPPEGVHLSLGPQLSGQTTEMFVDWSSLSSKEAHHSDWDCLAQARVEYGLSEVNLNLTTSGDTQDLYAGGNTTRFLSSARMDRLEPGNTYYYRVGSFGQYSPTFSFQTFHTDFGQAGGSPMRIGVYGDFGVVNDQSQALLQKYATTGELDFIIHAGDLAYNLVTNQATRGDQFMRQIEPMASRFPYMTCPGNHEEAQNFTHYTSRFTVPNSGSQLYFSYNVGPVHFVSISTELYFYSKYYSNEHILQQYKWIERDLQQAQKDRHIRPWIVVYGHRPLYCTLDRNDDPTACTLDTSNLRDGISYTKGVKRVAPLEPLFHTYGVDFYFSGHMHSYERLWPTYRQQVMQRNYDNPQAMINIVGGSAGCQEDLDSFDRPYYPWSAFHSDTYGFGVFTIYNHTHSHWKQVHSQNGTILDEILVTKNKPTVKGKTELR